MSQPNERAAEKARLLLRCRLTLDAFERGEPSAMWADFRAFVEASSGRLADLRSILLELKPMAAFMPKEIRRELAQSLAAHGFDVALELEQDRAAVDAIRARGSIRSEAEYRRVQAYADALITPEEKEEYLQLGALLDEYSSRGAT